MKKYSLCFPIAALLAITACQSVPDSLTPSLRQASDNFDGSRVISQPPVRAAANLSESVQTLGFEWTSSDPNRVILTAGVYGTQNVFGLAFNLGNRTIQASDASLVTDFGAISTRRFSISYSDFEAIATAPIVKMKISGANTYGVSSFGTTTSAVVNLKFPPFLQAVREQQGQGR